MAASRSHSASSRVAECGERNGLLGEIRRVEFALRQHVGGARLLQFRQALLAEASRIGARQRGRWEGIEERADLLIERLVVSRAECSAEERRPGQRGFQPLPRLLVGRSQGGVELPAVGGEPRREEADARVHSLFHACHLGGLTQSEHG